MNGICGLNNLGNTCFMNSSIQCLSANIELTKYFLSSEVAEDIDNEVVYCHMIKQYYALIKGIWENNCVIVPDSFKKVLSILEPKFKGFQQHDSHECIIAILDCIHKGISYEIEVEYDSEKFHKIENDALEVWSNFIRNEYSKVIDLFYGQLASTINCLKCNQISNTYDPFCYISVPIRDDNSDINECMKNYIEAELLEEGNKYDCEKCGEKTKAHKSISIWRCPKYLIIQLKRFRINGKKMVKLHNTITFPLTKFDLRKYICIHKPNYSKIKSVNYSLYAISNHHGEYESGHYTAFTKRENGDWYFFNDESVKKVSNDQVVTQDAYILFYEYQSR